MKWLIAVILASTWIGATPGHAQTVDRYVVRIQPTARAIVLGDRINLLITVVNNGNKSSPILVVHLDVTDPSRSTSVDPEDWTATLSRNVGPLGPHQTAAANWTVQPIAAGSFAVYAVALSPTANMLAASNVLRVEVASRRSLNPGGILPVAAGIPTMIGGLLLIQLITARRSRRRVPA